MGRFMIWFSSLLGMLNMVYTILPLTLMLLP
jgi:hypothetical protein